MPQTKKTPSRASKEEVIKEKIIDVEAVMPETEEVSEEIAAELEESSEEETEFDSLAETWE